MFSNDRNTLRKMFFDVWAKFKAQQPLEPLEQVLAQIIQMHPEYHNMLDDPANLDNDYTVDMGQTNPFLHMSMHIAIQEQLSTNRPQDIQNIYSQLCRRFDGEHEAEHQMMECLGKMMWEAQRNNTLPDEDHYLECLRSLIG